MQNVLFLVGSVLGSACCCITVDKTKTKTKSRHGALFCATLRMQRTTDGFEIDCFAVRLAATGTEF